MACTHLCYYCRKPCELVTSGHSVHHCGVGASGGCSTQRAEQTIREGTLRLLDPFFKKYNHLGTECREDLVRLLAPMMTRVLATFKEFNTHEDKPS